MKRPVIAAALSWDGTRLPLSSLPPKARAFLQMKTATLPSAKKLADLLTTHEVEEIRICWVPQLRGGKTLAESFPTPGKKRVSFRATKAKRFGDILGVVYKK